MRLLVVIAHYYRPEPHSKHSSTEPRAREVRSAAVRQVIEAWRGHFGPSATLNIERHFYEPTQGAEHALDIAVLVRGEDHLLDSAFAQQHRLSILEVAGEEPRMLPFAARRVFADARYAYDMFVYSEDDLRPADGLLPAKIASFVEAFGWRRLALPNRYEWNPRGPALKTFIDGDTRAPLVEAAWKALPDEPFLRLDALGRAIIFRRAQNPHSGFFALTAEQLAHWIKQPHFDDLDCSFVGPLESAATLGILRTFPIYKPVGRNAGWMEIQHLDRRFSSAVAPMISKEAQAALARRTL